MLASLVGGLRRRIPGVNITVLSADPEATRRDFGTDAVGRKSLPAIARRLRRSRLLISGGGNLLQDVTGPFNIPYYLGLVEMARRYGAATMLLGQGIGPVDGRMGRRLIGRLANRIDAITIRDAVSADILAEMGVTEPPITLTADTVFALDLKEEASRVKLPRWAADDSTISSDGTPEPHELGAGQPAGNPRPKVGVSLRRRGLSPKGQRRMTEALARFADAVGVRLLLVPMQPSEDLPLAEEFQAALGGHRAAVAPAASWREALKVYEHCEAVIAMRLHALIFAALMGVPPLGISYDPKVDRFLDQIGLESLAPSSALPPGDSLSELIISAYEHRRPTREKVGAAIDELRRRAEANFEVAAALVEGAADDSTRAGEGGYKKVTRTDTLRPGQGTDN